MKSMDGFWAAVDSSDCAAMQGRDWTIDQSTNTLIFWGYRAYSQMPDHYRMMARLWPGKVNVIDT